MAELLADVFSASECASAGVQTDVLSLDVFICVRCAFQLSALHGLLLTRTAALTALVAPAVELCSAGAEAHWLLHIALVADRPDCSSAAPAAYVDNLKAWATGTSMALIWAVMTAGKKLVARSVAMWYRILA